MEPMRLKTGLFGFRRRQVLTYVDQLCADHQQQMTQLQLRHGEEMTALREGLEENLRTKEHALAVQTEENKQLEEQLGELAVSLEEKYALLTARQEEIDGLSASLQEAAQRADALEAELSRSRQTAAAAEELLAEKDGVIARQTMEVSRLRDLVSQLEESFASVREDANQSTAMVNCINLLHGRNRALTQKVARLEAKLEEVRSGGQIQVLTQKAEEQQEAIRSTEALFSAVRKEIQDALDSISAKLGSAELDEPINF